ncbi:MAG: hypothetical protein RMM30_09860 [Armatimonadota bacterium]|nr:hypothetical protein [Armatimonadota bacterium]MDW8156874.1 hypothetical protein [Armatimonadota bacterium]
MAVLRQPGWRQNWVQRGVGYSGDVLRFYVMPVLVVGIAWHWVVSAGWIPSHLLPPPDRVFVRILEALRSGVLAANLVLTVQRVVIAFGAALVVSLPIGVAMGSFRGVERLLTPAWTANMVSSWESYPSRSPTQSER